MVWFCEDLEIKTAVLAAGQRQRESGSRVVARANGKIPIHAGLEVTDQGAAGIQLVDVQLAKHGVINQQLPIAVPGVLIPHGKSEPAVLIGESQVWHFSPAGLPGQRRAFLQGINGRRLCRRGTEVIQPLIGV